MAQINPLYHFSPFIYSRSSSSSYFTRLRNKAKEKTKLEAISENLFLAHVLSAEKTKNLRFVRVRELIFVASPSVNDLSAIAIIV